MSSSLVGFHSQKQQQTAIIAGAAVASVVLLYKAYGTLFKVDDNKNTKSPPKSHLGIFETLRVISDPKLPWIFQKMSKDLNSLIFELNLPVPGHPKTVVVTDFDDVRSILEDNLTDKPVAIYSQMVEMDLNRNPSLFVMQANAEWHRRRKGTMPAFSPKHVRRMNDVAVKQADMWMEDRIAPAAESNLPIDIVDEMLKVILKAFCETALEFNISEEDMGLMIDEWDLVAREFILKSATNPFRKYLEPFLPERRRAREASLKIFDFLHRIIANYRSLESPLEGTVINLIMSNPTFKNDGQIASEIYAYIVAGHDTTAVSLSWALMELSKNPEEQSRLRASISNLRSEEWSKSDVLKNVVKEALRLHPVAATAINRTIGRDMVTKNGNYFLPKGTLVFLPFYPMFRNGDVYKDPDTFRPSRWENPTREMQESYVPFALGKQSCVGRALANAELHCILARAIQKYEFSIDEEGDAEFHLVLKPVGLRLKARKVAD